MNIKKYIQSALFVTIGGNTSINWGNIEEKWNSIEDVFSDGQKLLEFLIGSAAVLAVLMLIISGYTLITSTGDPDKIETGQRMLTGSLIGLGVVLIAWILVKFVLNVLGV